MDEISPIDQLHEYVKAIGIDIYRDKEELYKIYSSVASCEYDTAKRVISGAAEPFNLSYRQYLNLIEMVVKKQTEKHAQEKEILDDQLNKNKTKIGLFCLRICFSSMPSFNDPLGEGERFDAVNRSKSAFYLLSPEKAYTLSHNLQAFMCFQDPDFNKFYDCIQNLSEKSIKEMKALIGDFQITIAIKKVVEQLSDPPLQQWLRIRRGFYGKTTNGALKHNPILEEQREKYKNKDEELNKFVIETPEAKISFANKLVLDKCWKKFSKELKGTPFCLGTPLLVILMTDILDNTAAMDLLILFLCCTTEIQKIILTKVQKYRSEEPDGATDITHLLL